MQPVGDQANAESSSQPLDTSAGLQLPPTQDVTHDATVVGGKLLTQDELLKMHVLKKNKILKEIEDSWESTTTLIHWKEMPLIIEGIFPLSKVIADMAAFQRNYGKTTRGIPIVWYCGLHPDAANANRDMHCSFIRQLVQQHQFNLGAIGIDFNQLEEYHEATLFEVVVYLASQLPNTSRLYIFIDNVIFYERTEGNNSAKDAEEALLKFAGLSTRPEVNAVVKVFFTDPPHGGRITDYFRQNGKVLKFKSNGWGYME